jgi:HlyD family secretion protein/epimerase transport system membrane fusion protein
MPAEVVIKKGERTLMSYLLQPMTDTIVRAMRE